MKIGSKTSKAPRAAKPGFFCTACGNEQPRWFGHCPACGEWNTASEAPAARAAASAASKSLTSGKRWVPAGGQRAPGPVALAEVSLESTERTRTGMRELDRVLGGGIVPGSLLLVGGDPGIGKSTLVLQVACALAARMRFIEARGPAPHASHFLQKSSACGLFARVAATSCCAYLKT